MPQTNALSRALVALEQDSTLIAAYSTRWWARIPRQGGRGFHAKPGTDSTRWWAPPDLRGWARFGRQSEG